MRAIRWSDNDRHLGPFTWSFSDYRPLTLMLSSWGGGQDDDLPCNLRLSWFFGTLIVALPPILKPHRSKVFPKWDEATVGRLGRDYYWDIDERSYGFTVCDGHLSVHYGRAGGSSMDSSIEQRWGCFLPWTQWRHVRHSFYGLSGEHLYDESQERIGKLGTEAWHERWNARQARQDAVPTMVFAFKDFDGEDLKATSKIEEREWRFGEGWFKWLSLFRRAKIVRSLDLKFSGETGKRKGSWKGGTVGHSITMLPGELHEAAFKRYCAEHEMIFDGRRA